MTHLLVKQLRFTRSELRRCLEGVSAEDGVRRLMPMNCISWIVGHLASQENFLWVHLAQNQVLYPDLQKLVGYGQPASTPPLDEMWDAWKAITQAADRYLETLTPALMQTFFQRDSLPVKENVGTLLMRNIDHYWFHLGEAHAIRQMLGHQHLPDFVGDMSQTIYTPE